MNSLAPIILFTYNRLDTLKKNIEALSSNFLAADSDLIIYSDGPRNIQDEPLINEVRFYLKTIIGFKSISINESLANKGLAYSIISGVTEVLSIYKKAIVLEDDLITSTNFLIFMNSSLNFYEHQQKVFSISGYGLKVSLPKNYKYDVYFTPRGLSWGWATWKNRWENIDWQVKDFKDLRASKIAKQKFAAGGTDLYPMLKKQVENNLDSWAIRWFYSQFRTGQFTVYPVQSKVQNLGFDIRATHTNVYNRYKTSFDSSGKKAFIFSLDIAIDPIILKSFQSYYSLITRIIYGRIISPLYRIKQSFLKGVRRT